MQLIYHAVFMLTGLSLNKKKIKMCKLNAYIVALSLFTLLTQSEC